MGPRALLGTVEILSPRGLIRLSPKPVPPPDFSIRAACLRVSIIDSKVSSIGRTKQAEREWSACPGAPACKRVGVLGRKSREDRR